ncbi:hypothetical protein HUO09_17020 [Vibrio sp. Y2-5]|uniref:hypothetical protein n=1 Tax=Vibrio sp. Y2-5 TaxID=2743977 RepID=UPI001660681F|nr:hypothetical protein [Vibrio sp. Y2-5]MBD0788058.1 hypothetical protein [Vibrio sp. Y2-5]
MNKFIKTALAAVLVPVVLSGCTAFQFKKYEKSNKRVQDYISAQQQSFEYKKVKELDVPPIKPTKIEEDNTIGWLSKPVSQKSNGVPLSIVLKQIMKGSGASIDYDYDVDPNQSININFEGSIEETLKMVSLQANVFIRKTPTKIIVQRYIVRTFTIPAIAGKSSFQLGSNGSGGSTSNEAAQEGQVVATGSGDGQFAKFVLQDNNKTTDLVEGVKAILKTTGSRNSLSGSVQALNGLSTLVVRTTPELMSQVEEFVNHAISEMTKEVVLDIEVIEWQKNEGSEFGLDGLIQRAVGAGTISLGASSTQITDSGVAGLGWKGTDTYNGTDALVRFLRQYGLVSITTHQTVKALNQQPQEVDLSDVRSYVSKTTVTYSTSDSDPAVEIENSTVRDGVKMLVVPSIYQDHVYLRLNGTLVKFVKFDTQEISGVTVSNPRTRQSRFNVGGKFEYNRPVLLTSMKQIVEQSQDNRTAEVVVSNSGEKKIVDTLVLVTPHLKMEMSK